MYRAILALTFVLICTLAFADGVQPNGFGTETNPYLMESLDNLLWLSTNEKVWSDELYYLQTADIDATDTENWNDGEGFSPIGTSGRKFKGVYDGDNHTISNLHINRPDQDYIGLWGYTHYSTFTEIKLVNVSIIGGEFTGSLAGYCEGSGLIENCHSGGSVEGARNVGGLFGCLDGYLDDYYTLIISSCSSTSTVVGTEIVGGLIGAGYVVEISYCFVDCTVSATESYAGGICAITNEAFVIEYCYVQGEISSSDFAGSIIGYCILSNIDSSGSNATINCSGDQSGGITGCMTYAIINCCYFLGNLNGTSHSGGIVGFSADSDIKNCYVAGNITPSTASALSGTFNNYEYIARVRNCVWNTQTTGVNHAMGTNQESAIDCYGCTTAEMMQQSTYTNLGWDFVDETENGTEDYWDMSTDWNEGYPYIHDIWVYVDNDEEPTVPPVFETTLSNAYPNPFNPSTTIAYSLSESGPVEISVYNIRGQRITKLIDERQPAGQHNVVWNGTDSRGKPVSSGIYFYRMTTPDRYIAKKMVMVK